MNKNHTAKLARSLAVAASATALGAGLALGSAGAQEAPAQPADAQPAVEAPAADEADGAGVGGNEEAPEAEAPAAPEADANPGTSEENEAAAAAENDPEAPAQRDEPKYEDTIVRAGHTAYAEQSGKVSEDTIFGYSQYGIPKGWYVSVDEGTGKVSVSASPDAKVGDSYTVKVKVVDLYGRVVWAAAKFTVGE